MVCFQLLSFYHYTLYVKRKPDAYGNLKIEKSGENAVTQGCMAAFSVFRFEALWICTYRKATDWDNFFAQKFDPSDSQGLHHSNLQEVSDFPQ